MDIINCFSCSSDVPLSAKFCGSCGTRIKCQDCGAELQGNYNFCLDCGAEFAKGHQSSRAKSNSIKYTDTPEGKSFEATFSDAVGKNITETFGGIFMNGQRLKQSTLSQGVTKVEFDEEVEKVIDVKHEEVDQNSSSLFQKGSSIEDRLSIIFETDGDTLKLMEIRLKANSKADYFQRLTHLFIYYHAKIKKQKASKAQLINVLQSVNVYDSNYRKWFAKYHNINASKDGLSLIIPGEEKAKEILEDIFDLNKQDLWSPGSSRKGVSSTKSTKRDGLGDVKPASAKKTKLQSLSLVNGLNLHPAGAESLKDFYAKFTLISYYEKNLVFVYYLQKKINERQIGIDHIFTCYKNVGERVPGNLYQSLIDTKKNKAWIDTQNLQDIIVTTAGENGIDHDLTKNA